MQHRTKIAVSTLALAGRSPEEIVSIAQKENYILEFSSGLPHRADMEDFFLEAPVEKIPHNYFPAPKEPFVLNLGSTHEEIRNRSEYHCMNGIRLAARSGAPFFSAHAGFCVDPDPSELGKKLKQAVRIDKAANWRSFMLSLQNLLRQAEKYKVNFLIENNVIAPMNLYADGTNPLLCCDPDEMLQMLNEINHPFLGILLDTGHFKVSAPIQKFDLAKGLKKITPFVKCIHHSDNDGIFDSNQPLTEGYWFWDHIRDFSDIYHVLEVKTQSVEEINRQIALIRKKISEPS